VWLLGRHRLVCGDCRAAGGLMPATGGASVNLAFTSPPYASQRAYDESSGFQPIDPDHYVEWFESVQRNVRAVLAADGSWFVNIKEHCDDGQRSLYVKDLTIAHVRRWGWRFVDELCWVRSGVPGKWANRFKNGWEPVLHYAAQATIKFIPERVGHASTDVFDYSPRNPKTQSGFISDAVSGRREGIALPSNVMQIEVAHSDPDRAHTAEFPVALPAFFIRAYTDPSDTVLDPFIGSGTTLIAAEQLNRSCVGIELSPAYCDVIIQRWEQLTGGKAERESS